MSYELFYGAARRYDLHTPPRHYQHDHRFVLEELRGLPAGGRLLDVGCGTGVFLETARTETALDVFGIDASEAMVEIAREKVGRDRIEALPMQELSESGRYSAVVSLGWCFNYCASLAEARAVLGRFASALVPRGKMILQVAHAPNATGELREDREPGPDGKQDDVLFFYRFSRSQEAEATLRADYVYACRSLNELLHETHWLRLADVLQVAELTAEAGFEAIEIYDSWRRDPLDRSVSPFLVARRQA